MTIDFHSAQNRGMYATRHADADWKQAMLGLVDPCGTSVADIGCGGGIYSRGWRELGASFVTGVDFSAQMVADARESSADTDALRFIEGEAADTGLPDASFDIVFSRAVIHHLDELVPAFNEAFRILSPGGTFIIQDRTIEDVQQPASPEHLRGYFFDAFPRLLEIEQARRPGSDHITSDLKSTGFTNVISIPLYERRRTYTSPDDLAGDLRNRTGRSILHELSDSELNTLVDDICRQVAGSFPITEVDRWTVWTARKPSVD